MTIVFSLLRGLGRFALNLTILLAWGLVPALAYSVARCDDGVLGWALVMMLAWVATAWPLVLAAIVAALLLAIANRPFGEGSGRQAWMTVAAVAAGLAILGAIAGLNAQRSCSIGF